MDPTISDILKHFVFKTFVIYYDLILKSGLNLALKELQIQYNTGLSPYGAFVPLLSSPVGTICMAFLSSQYSRVKTQTFSHEFPLLFVHPKLFSLFCADFMVVTFSVKSLPFLKKNLVKGPYCVQPKVGEWVITMVLVIWDAKRDFKEPCEGSRCPQ